MEILKVLEEFEHTIEQCSRIPMTGKVIIHEDVIYDFLDKIHAMQPEAIREAEWIMRERDRILKEAEKESEIIIETAKEKLQRIAGESEIVKLARAQSEDIIEKAQGVAREVTQGSFNYADDVMIQLQGELEKILQIVKQSRDELRQNVREKREVHKK